MAHIVLPKTQQCTRFMRKNLLLYWAKFFGDGMVGREQSVKRLQRRKFRAQTLKLGNRQFRGDVADKGVLCERTAAQTTDGHVETAAARAIGRGYFRSGVFRARMQVHADFRLALRG